MAIEVGQALLRLRAEAGDLMGDLGKAEGQTNSWASNLGKNTKTLLTGAVLGGVTAVAGAVVGIGKVAFDASNETRTAAKDIQGQFGLTAEEAERTSKLAREAWGNNWGDSIGDVAEVMGTVTQQLGQFGDMSDDVLTKVATDAIALRDVFEVETGESIEAARTLMGRFGLDGQQSMDLITTGLQSSMNVNGDFLESMTEYGPVFADAGFSAEEMFSILSTGAKEGVLGTDKIGDAIKEMGIKLAEGGTAIEDGFKAAGLSYTDMAAQVSAGEGTWASNFNTIVAGINSIEDPLARQRAQVAIFGTMAEDMGVSFTEGLSSAAVSLEDFGGATDALGVKYESFEQLLSAGKRKLSVALAPLGDALLGIGEKIMPKVLGAVEKLAPIVEKVAGAVGGFIEALVSGGDPVEALTALLSTLGEMLGLTDGEIAGIVATAQSLIAGLQEAGAQVSAFLAPVLEAIAGFVSWKDILIILAGVLLATVVPAIIGVVTALAPIIAAVVAVIAIVALLRNAWESDFGGIQAKVQAVMTFIQALITTVLSAIKAFWDANGAAILARATQIWNQIKGLIEAVINAISSIINAVVSGIVAFWNAYHDELLSAAQGIWDAIQAAIDGVLDAISGILSAFTSLFKGDWRGFLDEILSVWEGIWESVKSVISRLWSGIRPLLTALWVDMVAWFNGIDWASLGTKVIDGIVAGLGYLWDVISAPFEALFGDMGDWFAGIDWSSLGSTIVNGIMAGLGSLGGRVLSLIQSLAGGGGNPGAAEGTRYWRGGLLTVGEGGRELVYVPRGARVYNNAETREMLAGAQGAGGGGTTINKNYTLQVTYAERESEADLMGHLRLLEMLA